MSKVWLEERFGRTEVNLAHDAKVVVNCSANQVIQIDKLYGPLSATGVRIRLEYNNSCSDWVVEREVLKSGGSPNTWVEVARWDCQLDWPQD